MALDLSDFQCNDFTTSRTLEDIISDTINVGQQILLVGACIDVHKMLRQQEVLQCIYANHIHEKRSDALLHNSCYNYKGHLPYKPP